MNKDLRIAFMGTPDFAVASLKALLDAGYPVVVVVTAPDRPAGRGRKLTPPAVKSFALERGLPVLQPERLKDPEFLARLEAFGVTLQVVVAFRMLPREVWALPRYGTFNLHASLLPDYRGAAPINWAIINGETETGVTTFFIDEQIDTGHIILQERTAIGPRETAGDLHDRLMALGAGLVVETVRAIADGNVSVRPQKHLDSPKAAPKLNRENCRLDWEAPADAVCNKVRGLCPYPAAWTLLENGGEALPVKVFGALPDGFADRGTPGQLRVSAGRLFAAAGDGWVEITEMQLPGKRRMGIREVLNGLPLEKSARFR